jgi:putative redox protein
MSREISVEIDQVGPSTGQGRVRGHTVLVDRPVEKGGSDRGPLGGEYLLLSLGGCFLSTLLAAARTREADVSNVRVSVTGTVGGVPERFESMALRVSGQYSDEDLMRKLVALSERGCLVTNTLRDAVAISVTLDSSSGVDGPSR